MAKKIAISLRKGGSGKTTTAVNLAVGLYKRGKKSLLVDLDPQANATISVGIDPLTLTKHINTLFTDINTKNGFWITDTPLTPRPCRNRSGYEGYPNRLAKGVVRAD